MKTRVHRWKPRYPDSPVRGKGERGEKRVKKENVELWTSKAGPMLIYTGYERKPLCALKGGKKKRREKENKKKKIQIRQEDKERERGFPCVH